MPAIDTAEDAVNGAQKFIERYYVFHTLQRVVREGEKWVTEFDVGLLGTDIVRVSLDARTGKVIEYTRVK